jgi:hypothetical protein
MGLDDHGVDQAHQRVVGLLNLFFFLLGGLIP